MKKPQPQNLYELKPRRLVQWETGEDGRITLLVPKFSGRFLGRWLQPRLRRPYMRVKLDEYGSFVWQHCDGELTVAAIGAEMISRFGAASEPLFDRIARFLQQLESSGWISTSKNDSPAI